MTKVEITTRYMDVELSTPDKPMFIDPSTIREVTNERAEQLVRAGVAKIIEIQKEEEKKPTKKTAAKKSTTRKSTTRKTAKN